MSRKLMTDAEGEVRELQDDDFAAMKPFDQVVPAETEQAIKRRPGQRGPGKMRAKRLVTLRVDADVLERYRSSGSGWQTRMASVIKAGMPKDA